MTSVDTKLTRCSAEAGGGARAKEYRALDGIESKHAGNVLGLQGSHRENGRAADDGSGAGSCTWEDGGAGAGGYLKPDRNCGREEVRVHTLHVIPEPDFHFRPGDRARVASTQVRTNWSSGACWTSRSQVRGLPDRVG